MVGVWNEGTYASVQIIRTMYVFFVLHAWVVLIINLIIKVNI